MHGGLRVIEGGALSLGAGARLSVASRAEQPLDPALLRWPPPTLDEPLVKEVPAGTTFYSQTGITTTSDVEIKMPATARQRKWAVWGGRNVVLIGGLSEPKSEDTGGVVSVADAAESYFIEGHHVKGNLVDKLDMLDVQRGASISTPDVTIQNCIFERAVGTSETTHADDVQPQGGVRAIKVDKCTFRSQYQGLFLEPNSAIESVEISRSNFAYEEGGDEVTFLLWFFTSKTYADAYPVKIGEGVYIEPREGQTVAKHAVMPSEGEEFEGQPIGAYEVEEDGVTYVRFHSPLIKGQIIVGSPPDGDWGAEAGLGYESPGYA